MVVVGAVSTHNEEGIKRRFPVTKGLIAGTTKQEGTQLTLIPQNSTVLLRNRAGII